MKKGIGLPVFSGVAIGPAVVYRKAERTLPVSSGDPALEKAKFEAALETVGLEGKPFTIHVSSGDKVKKGQLMIEVDLEAVKAAGLPTITPMLICNTDDYPTFDTIVGKDVTCNDVVIKLAK